MDSSEGFSKEIPKIIAFENENSKNVELLEDVVLKNPYGFLKEKSLLTTNPSEIYYIHKCANCKDGAILLAVVAMEAKKKLAVPVGAEVKNFALLVME